MLANSNGNQARESGQVFSIHETIAETQTPQTAENFGFATECPGFGKSGCDASTQPWLYQRMPGGGTTHFMSDESSMSGFLQLENDLRTNNLH